MEDPRTAALEMIQQHETTADELWMKYWASGGTTTSAGFQVYLHGMKERDDYQLTIRGWAIQDIAAL